MASSESTSKVVPEGQAPELEGEELATIQAEETPSREEAPTKKVSPLFQIVFFLTSLASNLILLPVIIYLIPMQVDQFSVSKTAAEINVGLVQGIGGIFFLLAAPIAGALSDRSTSNFGRRRIWMAIHALCASIAIVWLANSGAIWMLIVGWALLQFFGSSLQTILQAIITDQVPVRQRGLVSASFGLAIPLGAVLGGLFVTVFLKNTPYASYYVYMAAVLISVLLLVLILKDKPYTGGAEARSWKHIFAHFLVNPRKHPDFFWALFTRLLVFMGYYAMSAFLVYYVDKGLHYEALFPGKKAIQGVIQIQSTMTVLILISTFAAGFISDKIQRRKPVVVISGVILAIGLALPALVPSWNVMMVFAVLLGIGYGGFISVDTALITQVLPNPESRGKDLGVINVALGIPLIVAPLMGSFLVVSFGYGALFAVAGVLALLGSLMILPIKNVR